MVGDSGPARHDGSTFGTENGGDVQSFAGKRKLKLKKSVFSKCLQEAPSGNSPGPGGCSNEILRVCLEDGELLSLLHFAAQDFARGEVPLEVTQFFTLASMTAVRNPDGGVRGIATGTVFRRLVAKCLSRQYISEVERVCAPFQFAMSTGRHRLRGACSESDD